MNMNTPNNMISSNHINENKFMSSLASTIMSNSRSESSCIYSQNPSHNSFHQRYPHRRTNTYIQSKKRTQNQNLYEPIRNIGSGSFGKIVKIRRICDDAKLVWKELEFSNMTSFEKTQVDTEINLLRSLSQERHPNIVQYFDSFSNASGSKTFIVMEYCQHGDLASYIESHRRNETWAQESFIWKIMAQVTSALYECHHHDDLDQNIRTTILHRDVKPANILLDKNMNAKLCDFGLAIKINTPNASIQAPQSNDKNQDSQSMRKSAQDDGMCGTPFYMAPERVNRCAYDGRSDIWSLGCIIYEMAALTHPFMSKDETELANRINSGFLQRLPEHYSPDLQSTCKWMLRRDVTRRPTVQDLSVLPQIRNTFSKIRYHIQETKLQYKRCRFYHEVSKSKRKLKMKEQYLISYEAELRNREQKLLERESRTRSRTLESWDKQQHQEQQQQPHEGQLSHKHAAHFDSSNPRLYDSIHMPHLIDDPTREYSPRAKMESCYPPNTYNHYYDDNYHEIMPRSRPSYQNFDDIHHPNDYFQNDPFYHSSRRRKYDPTSVVMQNGFTSSPTYMDHEYEQIHHKRQRINHYSPSKSYNTTCSSPDYQCPVVSYEEYNFRRSH